MVIDRPRADQIPGLRRLWSLAFGDTAAFLDLFFDAAYTPDRCRCVTAGEQVAAALYWFDTECDGQKYAYLYAVATHPEFRGRGLCRKLMADTHAVLAEQGYAGVLLVPQEEGLRKMYAGMGYREATRVSEFFCNAAEEPVSIRPIGREEYAALRRQYLPYGGVIQEGTGLALLEKIAGLYAGEDFLLAAGAEKGSLWGMELLGNIRKAPGILKALGYSCGTFRTCGEEKPFAMVLPLREDTEKPSYFGFAFD